MAEQNPNKLFDPAQIRVEGLLAGNCSANHGVKMCNKIHLSPKLNEFKTQMSFEQKSD